MIEETGVMEEKNIISEVFDILFIFVLAFA
jgi:hypothetical protein